MKNMMVQYQGGGYSGCYWEWNFFYFDSEGKFHDIFSSGSEGIDNVKDAENLLAKEKSSTYVYDATQESAWAEFNKETHPALVLHVSEWFEQQNFEGIEPIVICSVCGTKTKADDVIYDTEYGPDAIICIDCRSLGQCDNCEYYSDDIQEYEDEHLCPDCIEYKEEEKLQEKQDNMLWASLATGTPDLFSDEMRWFWVS